MLFVGWGFFSTLKKKSVGLEMVGIFVAVFHQRLMLTESEVLHLEMFLLGKRKKKGEYFIFQNGNTK